MLVYLLPVWLYFGVCEYLLYLNKETTPINHVIDNQISSKQELYYMRAFFDNSPTMYKLGMMKRTSPDILVLGQSIVLQFRKEMFHPYQSVFYNMGYAINNAYDLQSVVTQIQEKRLHKPKLVILGLDLSLVKKTNTNYHVNMIDDPHPDEIYKQNFMPPHLNYSLKLFIAIAKFHRLLPLIWVWVFGANGVQGIGEMAVCIMPKTLPST
ncbi:MULTISPECIES: hypothetical protein [unclassified Mucilaginibacter]|uniref:hypothetical protein n=1 Tax=unclassified Mucilaginibacter TaxID=2617802 RepID=UPI003390FA6C